ncbi:MAG: Rieske (2Fe-2S) protein [Thermoplasmata archaeon]|nr:Rieske (2Fe-2S) protein [Thermoplasmata archaeon]
MPEPIRIENAPLPAEGKGVRVLANGIPVAVFRVGGAFHAIDARCTHRGGPLDQGALHGTQVTCPWHGSVFDVTTGAVAHGPAEAPEHRYRARVEGSTLILEPV